VSSRKIQEVWRVASHWVCNQATSPDDTSSDSDVVDQADDAAADDDNQGSERGKTWQQKEKIASRQWHQQDIHHQAKDIYRCN